MALELGIFNLSQHKIMKREKLESLEQEIVNSIANFVWPNILKICEKCDEKKLASVGNLRTLCILARSDQEIAWNQRWF